MNQSDIGGSRPAQAAIIGGSKSKATGPGPEIMAASTLDGNDVVNLAGDKLGDIKEIMLDVPNGRIAYAVLSRGGLLGVGDKLFAIPWGALTLDSNRKCFVLDISEESLKDSDGFDKDNWPSMADDTWARGVYQRYNQPPYW